MALLIDYFSGVDLISYELEDYKIHKKVFNSQRSNVNGQWSKKMYFCASKRMDRQK